MLALLLLLIIGGAIIGALGRLVLPGPDPIGFVRTVLAGWAGSFLGGLLGRLVFGWRYRDSGLGGLGTGSVTEEPLPWYERFTKRYTVITYDRRSSGRSAAPESPHGLELFARDAFELLRHLGIPRAVIWGESAGVPIATTFALK